MMWADELLSFTRMYLRLGMSQAMNIAMAYFLMSVMLGCRRKMWVAAAFGCYVMIVMNWLLSGFLRTYYGEQRWWQILYSFMVFTTMVLNVANVYYTYEGGLLKTAVGLLVTDLICSVLNTVVQISVNVLEGRDQLFVYMGEFVMADLLIPVLQCAVFGIFLHFFGSYIKRFREYQIRHKMVAIVFVACFFIFGSISRVADLAVTNERRAVLVLEGLVGSMLIGGILLLIFRTYEKSVTRKNDYLKTKGNLLKAHYMILQQQIRHIERSRARNNEKMEKILQMQEEWRGEGLENYLKDLRRQYENIAAGIYCSDWAVDAMLTNLAAACRKKEIQPDFQFQKYDRGEIREEDILQLLRSLGEAAIRASGEGDAIRLQAAVVKNQLVLTCMCPAGKKISEKDHRELLEKYQGNFQSSVKEKVQMVSVMLQNH